MKNGKKLVSLFAVFVLLLTGIGAFAALDRVKAASIVQLDVNPSIEIHVDEDGDVIKTEALNADGKKVLEGMKLKGADADTAVNAIVGSLLRNGYIDEVANTILLTVEDENTARGEKLKEELTEEVNEILKATDVHAAVLSQNMKETSIAREADISQGKATLVQNIVDANETYDAKELAKLSVNELNLIVSNSKNKVENVTSTGNAAENAYIGKEKAKETAFAHAQVKEADVRELEVEMDYEYKTMVYELDFSSGEYEYDYVIDAKTGEILHSHREIDDDYTVPTVKNEVTTAKQNETTTKQNETTTAKQNEGTDKAETTVNDIGREKAKSIALSHAGLSESAVNRLRVERDRDDGRIEYSVEFTADGKEYDYEISGETGRILDYDVEIEDRD